MAEVVAEILVKVERGRIYGPNINAPADDKKKELGRLVLTKSTLCYYPTDSSLQIAVLPIPEIEGLNFSINLNQISKESQNPKMNPKTVHFHWHSKERRQFKKL
jgi:hypothetical protein